jgi:hypothetical protein
MNVPAPPRVLTPPSLAWKYQERQILGYPLKFMQVDEERHALSGAFLTVLAAWNVSVPVEAFREGDEASCRYVMSHLGGSGEPLVAVPLRGKSLLEALDFDVPLLLEIDPNAESRLTRGLAPYVVLLRVQGEALTLADPFRGLRTERRADVERVLKAISVVYVDVQGWRSLGKGDENERVGTLQQFLLEQKHRWRKPNNRYDYTMEDAIRRFQRYYRLEGTGELDELTLLMLSTRANPSRPRLFVSDLE